MARRGGYGKSGLSRSRDGWNLDQPANTISSGRHCERSAAIQLGSPAKLDCFGIAPRNDPDPCNPSTLSAGLALIGQHRPDALAAAHQVEALVDLLERQHVGDQVVDID